MSGDLEVRGGAGGMAARHADLRRYAGLLDEHGSQLQGIARRARGLSLDGDLLSGTVFAPTSAARAQVRLLSASYGPRGTSVLAVRLEAQAVLLRTRADLIELADSGTDLVRTSIVEAGAGVFGATLPLTWPVVLGGTAALGAGVYGWNLAERQAGLLGDVLSGDVALEDAAGRLGDAFGQAGTDSVTDAQRFLLEHPGITDTVVTGLPHAVRGALGPAGVLLPDDYEGTIALLLRLGQAGGLLPDTPFAPEAPSGPFPTQTQTLASLMASSNLNHRLVVGDDTRSQVRIVEVTQDGVTRYVVQVPGTQQWELASLDPSDLTTNLELMDDGQSEMVEAIVLAMAGMPDGAEVMLMGHSQGGIVAATLAGHADLERLTVVGVLTAGSPVARVHVPEGVSVLSVEHLQDPVPRSEGTDNPDTVDRTTVYRDLGLDELEQLTPDKPLGVIDAHSAELYEDTIAQIEAAAAAGDPTLADAVADLSGFFGTGTTSVYRDHGLTRPEPGP